MKYRHLKSYWAKEQTWITVWSLSEFFLFLRFYLFIFREGKGGRKRGRETSICGCLLHAPDQGPGPQPRHAPWLGIKPVTCRLALNPLSHTSQGCQNFFKNMYHDTMFTIFTSIFVFFILYLNFPFFNFKNNTIYGFETTKWP